MSNYAYVAVDSHGAELRELSEVTDQSEALHRIRQMGLFPTRVAPVRARRPLLRAQPGLSANHGLASHLVLRLMHGRIKPRRLAVFTRQLATLLEAGMPLVRGLRILHQQEENRHLKQVILDLAVTVESGSTLSEALGMHERIFNRLYINMVKAGELGGAMDVTLVRLAEFLEKAEKLKGKVKAAMFYPATVLFIACAILSLLMIYVIPKFKAVFGEFAGAALPPFTVFVFKLSEIVKNHAPWLAAGLLAGVIALWLALKTLWGRYLFDLFKLQMPVIGPLFRKVAISRFSRTLGTLISNGVPILQALTVVKKTAGNTIVGKLISAIHENVKQGEPIATTLKGSRIFPPIVAGMVDVGEQTGALPEMLMKIADTYDDEVDNATSALTSLIEPIMIVFLAVVVGGIVIAMFLPILSFQDLVSGTGTGQPAE